MSKEKISIEGTKIIGARVQLIGTARNEFDEIADLASRTDSPRDMIVNCDCIIEKAERARRIYREIIKLSTELEKNIDIAKEEGDAT